MKIITQDVRSPFTDALLISAGTPAYTNIIKTAHMSDDVNVMEIDGRVTCVVTQTTDRNGEKYYAINS